MVRAVAALTAVALVAACSTGSDDHPTPEADNVPRMRTDAREAPAVEARRTTVVCRFRDLVGVVVIPERQRVEIVETNQEFAGDTGLPATGTGVGIAALTLDGLSVGSRCRDRAPLARSEPLPAPAGPWPETAPTWLRCALYGDVVIDARRLDGGYALSIGQSVRASLLPNRRGRISFTGCRRFVVTGNPIP